MLTPCKPHKKPEFDFDRPFSWSQMSSFKYAPEQWYTKYQVHGKCSRDLCVVEDWEGECPVIATSPEMLFGKMVGERLAADPTYLPEIPRRSIFEHEMRPMLPPSTGKGDPVPLVAFMDAYEPKEAAEEYKTGRKKWDKERVRKHGQVDFYLLGLYLTEGIKPETIKFRLHWMPTHIKNGEVTLVEPFKPLHFKADRTFAEILLFWKEIEATRQAMIAYYAAHR